MKSYTDISQSNTLSKILPLESADMKILPFTEREYRIVPINDISVCDREDEIYAWSLAAMLEHLRKHNLFPEIKDAGDYILMDITFYDEDEVVRKVINPVHFIRVEGKNILDACYELILKLHEQNLL